MMTVYCFMCHYSHDTVWLFLRTLQFINWPEKMPCFFELSHFCIHNSLVLYTLLIKYYARRLARC